MAWRLGHSERKKKKRWETRKPCHEHVSPQNYKWKSTGCGKNPRSSKTSKHTLFSIRCGEWQVKRKEKEQNKHSQIYLFVLLKKAPDLFYLQFGTLELVSTFQLFFLNIYVFGFPFHCTAIKTCSNFKNKIFPPGVIAWNKNKCFVRSKH